MKLLLYNFFCFNFIKTITRISTEFDVIAELPYLSRNVKPVGFEPTIF